VDDKTAALVDALHVRRIWAYRVGSDRDWHGVTVSMSGYDLERFLDIVIKQPLTEDDGITRHILARSHELEQTDEQWEFECTPGLSEARLIKLHVYARIPASDVAEVIARLKDIHPID
jgi:hypothetical protein